MYQVDDVMLPCQWKTFTDHVVEEINQVKNHSTKTVLNKLDLETFLVCCFVVAHHQNSLFNVTI